jgi:signal transduction histidine kinase
VTGSSIGRKLIALTLVVALVPILCVLGVVAAKEIRDLRAEMLASSTLMGSVVAEFGAAAMAFDDRQAAEQALKVLARHDEFRDATLYDMRGRLFASFMRAGAKGDSGSGSDRLDPAAAKQRTELEGDRIHVVQEVDHDGVRFGTLVLHTSTARLQASVNAYLYGLALLILGILVAAALLAWALEKMISRRLRRLADVAQRIAQKEDYSVRATDAGADEISLLAEAFNRMLAEIGRRQEQAMQAIRVRDEFLSVASHELKTPLTSLKLQVQSLLEQPPTFTDQGEAQRLNACLALTDRQVRRLERLIGNLLDVSRIAVGRFHLQVEDVNLPAMVRDVVAQFSAEISRSGAEVTLELSEQAVGRWDPLRLEQVVVNLLSNALKYGDGKPIDILVTASDDAARLTVKDQGVGVDVANHARIFERFERAVSVNYGGLGLGLYITRQIVQAHGGSIQVESALGRGATFIVDIPRRRQESP